MPALNGISHVELTVSDLGQAIALKHSGIIDAGFGSAMVFRDPENVQLELCVHSSAVEDMVRYRWRGQLTWQGEVRPWSAYSSICRSSWEAVRHLLLTYALSLQLSYI
jgi:hypothetical protein